MSTSGGVTTCSDVIIQELCAAGLDVCFANPGTTEMHLVAALNKASDRMRSILCLQESVVTGASDGYARVKGKAAVSLLHLGPGLGNGLCNLHNARRGGSPVLALVGEMATWHKGADASENQDLQSLASIVSGHVITVTSPETVAAATQKAIAAMHKPVRTAAAAATDLKYTAATAATTVLNGLGLNNRSAPCVKTALPDSKVVTLLVPHDFTWTEAPQQQQLEMPGTSSNGKLADNPAAVKFVRDCAAALKGVRRGKAALLLGGAALLAKGDALPAAARIASALGAALLSEPLTTRTDRGAGLPHVTRLPYFPQEAAAELRNFEVVLLLDQRRPVAMFGYKDGPSQLLSQADDKLWELDASWNVAEALELLEREFPGAADVKPGVNCGGLFAVAHRPPVPTGPLSAASVCQVVAALQPPDTILVDESITSGFPYWEASKGCPPFMHLCLTGGAIGSGLPMATGAAVAAAAGQQVINIQADGSAMYSFQALWTQATQKLKVLTIIFANSTYEILQVEAKRQATGTNALTSLSGPNIDWVSLATGLGVLAGKAETGEELAELFQKGLQQEGPFLIQAVIPGVVVGGGQPIVAA